MTTKRRPVKKQLVEVIYNIKTKKYHLKDKGRLILTTSNEQEIESVVKNFESNDSYEVKFIRA